jgi:DNA-binding transcriptional regulator YiaG
MNRDRVTQLIKREGLNVNEAATMFNVTEAAVRHWIYGRRDVPGPVVRIIQYCENKGLSLRQFFSEARSHLDP